MKRGPLSRASAWAVGLALGILEVGTFFTSLVLLLDGKGIHSGGFRPYVGARWAIVRHEVLSRSLFAALVGGVVRWASAIPPGVIVAGIAGLAFALILEWVWVSRVLAPQEVLIRVGDVAYRIRSIHDWVSAEAAVFWIRREGPGAAPQEMEFLFPREYFAWLYVEAMECDRMRFHAAGDCLQGYELDFSGTGEPFLRELGRQAGGDFKPGWERERTRALATGNGLIVMGSNSQVRGMPL